VSGPVSDHHAAVAERPAAVDRRRQGDCGFVQPTRIVYGRVVQAMCVDGDVDMAVEWVPRPEFGLVHPRLDIVTGGIRSVGGATVTMLSVNAALTVTDSRAHATVRLRAGQDLSLAGSRPRPGRSHRSTGR
jgi:hypothetical protein